MTRGAAGPPQPGHHPPHQHPGPGRRRGAGGGRDRAVTASRLLQSCSQALQRDSAQPHRSQPHRRGLFPQPGGNTPSPPSPRPATAPLMPEPPRGPTPRCLSPPQDHRRLLQPQHRQGSPLQGLRAMESRVGGQSASAHHLCCARGSIWIWPCGSSRPKPQMGSGELSTNSCYGTSPGGGRKDLGCFFLEDGTERDVRSHGKVWRFLKGFFEPQF